MFVILRICSDDVIPSGVDLKARMADLFTAQGIAMGQMIKDM